jgi:two-component system cell cycle sensor histidine kinase/response regulator CckA
MLNLLVNARDAMPNGGSALVETTSVDLGEDYARIHFGVKPGPHVLLMVSDSGVGIDAETQKHIFEPFFTTKPQESGTGLGLATVYGIVKQNGGDIWVYSELGVGSTFKVYLPRIDGGGEMGRTQTAIAKESGGTETVLVVEDETGVRDVVCTVLRMAGYRVLEAPDPHKALEISRADTGVIHLLVTDVVMPHMGGQELANILHKERPSLKVLYLSGYTENSIVKHGVLEPTLNFLQKPFEFEKLLAKVREALQR